MADEKDIYDTHSNYLGVIDSEDRVYDSHSNFMGLFRRR